MGEDTRRINVIFPAQLLEELDALIPARKRSDVIVKATAEYIRKLKVLTALKQSAGAWNDISYPELTSSKDINAWVAEKRAQWRSKPLTTQEKDNA